MRHRTALLLGLPIAGLLAQAKVQASPTVPRQPIISNHSKPVLLIDGLRFHDLDGNGQVTPYEDWRLSPRQRAEDLVRRMTLAEKAGLLMHGTPPSSDGTLTGWWKMPALSGLIRDRHIRFFIHRLSGDPAKLAEIANEAQVAAESSRLGIPVVFSSDPRNQVKSTFGLSTASGRFSLWPEFPGLGAIGDPDLVRRSASIVSAEYRAVGIRMALSPMADLATEPRWPRVNGTFGDEPYAVGRLVGAYVAGMQGGTHGVGAGSVASVVKHWVAYGAQPEGFDAHNPYGRYLRVSARSLNDHIAPFKPAFSARAAGVMPTYGILPPTVMIAGKPAEQVGGGFNRALLTDLLRKTHGFDGIVLTDWKITDDCPAECETGTLDHEKVGMPWGVEGLSKEERFAKALAAGVDQFGGVMDADLVLKLVNSGTVSPKRLDQSVTRLLKLMFELGLFESAYVDPRAAVEVVGSPRARAAGLDAQKRSLTLLQNKSALLPLSPRRAYKVWLSNISRDAAVAAGLIPVERPEDADLSILRIATPYTQRKNFFFGARHHEGMPEFLPGSTDVEVVKRAARAGRPVIVSVYLDRPAILTTLLPHVTALIGDYGVEDAALLSVIRGQAAPNGRLPFELPRSAAAVAAQKPDRSSDSVKPLFPRGFGLRYRAN